MIFYPTKKTVERYKFPMPSDFIDIIARNNVYNVIKKEKGDRLVEWGMKIFYFDGRKCLQIMNFASKLTIILVDIKMKDRETIGDGVVFYLLNLYAGNKEMTKLLERYFSEHAAVVFDKLTDRSVVSSLNRMETDFLLDGYLLYNYIEDGILHTKELNQYINQEVPMTMKINGKTNYIYPYEYFEQLLKERYQNQ